MNSQGTSYNINKQNRCKKVLERALRFNFCCYELAWEQTTENGTPHTKTEIEFVQTGKIV